jgi:hypothetical protein
MTRPGSTNQIQLSPEGAALAQELAKKTGMPGNAVAVNARVVGRHELESLDGAVKSKAYPSGPVFEIANGVLQPWPGASMMGLRLGMSVHYSNGAASRWTIVMRREGSRVCEIDYADEETCETEMAALRVCIDSFLVSDVLFSFHTQAIGIRNFNPFNGGEI